MPLSNTFIRVSALSNPLYGVMSTISYFHRSKRIEGHDICMTSHPDITYTLEIAVKLFQKRCCSRVAADLHKLYYNLHETQVRRVWLVKMRPCLR
jgi:hypothetical protein